MKDKCALLKARNGFSLMEMLVVLAVIALGTALTIPSMGGARDRMRLRSAAGKTAAALRHARSRAISEQRIMQAFFDLENRRLVIRPWPQYAGLAGIPAFGGVNPGAGAAASTADMSTGSRDRPQIYSLPGDICFTDPRTFRGAPVPGVRFQITFFPGGGSNGGRIRVASGADCFRAGTEAAHAGSLDGAVSPGIRVDLVTGLVEVTDDAV
ncbi:MAG: hypothetical protein CSB33_03515 [Desulfobacterales bacterium]|nr:MAG: hypothetical protein CSB33_03515 [Desulfobacterales bacterium]